MTRMDALEALVAAYRQAHPGDEALDELDLPAWSADMQEVFAKSYPFADPQYAGQMLKPPHPIAWLTYAATMWVNPNNHARDGGPHTTDLELEAIDQLRGLFGWADQGFGHLTSGGTIANLEALWVAREVAGTRYVLHSHEAHYTHARMAALLGLEAVAVETDAEGRMVPEALDHALATHPKACVVLSMGTTGTGSIDAAATLIPIARRHGARIHADAAYGGFFAVLCGSDHLAVADQTSFKALSNVDSIAIDPHKHGLQPYGCGAILYADLEDVRPFGHDSPYTYYSSAAQHLGQISLECSRAGAAAAALALTFRQLPLVGDGAFARGLAASRRAAVGFAGAVAAHDNLQCFRVPQLDIVVWSHVDERCNTALYEALQAQKEPVYVSQFQIEGKAFPWLRCVFMKPSHADYIDTLMMAIDAALSSLPSK